MLLNSENLLMYGICHIPLTYHYWSPDSFKVFTQHRYMLYDIPSRTDMDNFTRNLEVERREKPRALNLSMSRITN